MYSSNISRNLVVFNTELANVFYWDRSLKIEEN